VTAKQRLSRRMFRATLLPRLAGKRIIPRMFFEVCGDCQNNCDQCQHSAMRAMYAGYQLPLVDVQAFIDATRRSRYYIYHVCINGPGEPLLWTHVNEGVQMLAASGVVSNVSIYTNGQALDRLTHATWQALAGVHVNVYPGRGADGLVMQAVERYADKIKAVAVGGFRQSLTARVVGSSPCVCESSGPMYLDGRVWPYCGPIMFDACRLVGANPFMFSTPVDVGYMDCWQPDKRIGRMVICEACNANGTLLAAAPCATHRQMDAAKKEATA
jgi:hypothetical protein